MWGVQRFPCFATVLQHGAHMLRPKLAVGVVDRGNITEHSVCLYIIEENLLLQVEQDAHEELQRNKKHRVRIGLRIVYSEMKAYLSVNFTKLS